LTRRLKISQANIKDALTTYLISISAVNDEEDIIGIDLNLPFDKDGLVPVTVVTRKIKNA
jgi:hypothetical protein